MTYARHAAALARQIEHAPFLDRLRALDPAGFDADMVTPVVDEAARFAEAVIAPVDAVLDRGGCRLVDGRVVTSDAHRAAWAAFVAAGWPTLNVAAAFGGQGLPLLFQTACEELFNRASPAFTMLPTPGRTAVAMLAPFAGADMVAEWLPRLATGEWAATICISEPDAGSDVGRIRTRATLDDGAWRVSGEKCWISYGDHDLSPRIGHCLIARTGTAAGVRGLSLFLVPSVRADRSRNAVFVRRIEEKMGLHGSPTCVLGFEAADAVLIGQEGRGLQQMFTMMLRMRLSTGAQGIGVAAGAAESALAYARDRRQGGDADAPPVAIAEHVDVRRQLLSMAARVETGRGLTLAAAAALDLAERETDPAAAAAAGVLAQWLLPIVKDLGARTGFDVASDAIQTFGGAGYTREWPIEQAARDARVFAVFEGTSGIQALDMLHRRLWREKGAGLAAFVALARADAAGADADAGAAAGAVLGAALDQLEAVSAVLAGRSGRPRDAEAGAVHYLDLCGTVAGGWIAVRLSRLGGDPTGDRLAALGRFTLAELPARVERDAALAVLTAERLDAYAALVAD